MLEVWGRADECVVISQFAQKAEECVGLLDITPLCRLTPHSGSWQLTRLSHKKTETLNVYGVNTRGVIITHEQSAFDPFVHLGEGRGVVV